MKVTEYSKFFLLEVFSQDRCPQKVFEYFQMRHREYTDRGWENFKPNELEIDECDRYSSFIFLYSKEKEGDWWTGKLLAGGRLIDGTKTVLPIQKFKLNKGERIRKGSFEVSRVINISSLPFEETLLKVYAHMVLMACNKGCNLYAVVRSPHLRLFEYNGFKGLFRVIGPVQEIVRPAGAVIKYVPVWFDVHGIFTYLNRA